MTKILRGGLVAAVALTMTAVSFAESADAASKRNIIGGVAAGLVIGGIVAGAAAANARERVYVTPRSSCRDHKRKAEWNESRGRDERAQYWWNRYEDCIDGH